MCQKRCVLGLNLNSKEVKFTALCRIIQGFLKKKKVSVLKVTSASQVNAVVGKEVLI